MDYRYRSDEELKTVNSEWFELVPNKWNVLMFKRVVESVKNGIWGDEPKNNEDDIPCIRILNFNRNEMEVDIEDLTTRNIPVVKQRDFLLKKGDLLIEKSGGGEKNPVGFVARYNHDLPAVYANFMAKISLKKTEARSDYVKYLCSNIYNKRIHLDAVNQTTGIQNLDTETYFKRLIPLPNINEQQKIAKFLDKKTAQFDSIIFKKEALIEKLEEAKKSLISEVVTGKVKVVKTDDGYELVERKKEEMKDSGVEWLGNVPNIWQQYRSKYLWRKEKREVREGDGVVTAFRDGQVTLRENRRTDGFTFAIKEVGYQGVLRGDLVISAMDAFAGAMGISESDGKCSPVYSVCSPIKKLIPNYYSYLLKEMSQKGYILSLAKGIRERSTDFRYSEFANTILLYPSFAEQEVISDFLDKKVIEINQFINKIKKQIQKLKEAKQSLISEAVTGKIEILD